MAVSPPPAPSSIDLSGLPPRVVEAAARVLALCREELRSEPRPEAPEEVELRVREATNEFARDVMGAVIENRDDGASRIERDGQSWFRVRIATAVSRCWRPCSVCFPFSGNCSPTAPIRGRSFTAPWPASCPISRPRSSSDPIGLKGFVVQPRRWVVERTIAWLNRCRRLAKDWENLNRNALAFIKLASIRLMLRKLCNPT